MESSKSADALKRIHEIEKELSPATELTACIVVLPGKECFYKLGDPKAAIRCGMALTNRLTQFVTPWDETVKENVIESKITSAVEDLCRQLGYVRE